MPNNNSLYGSVTNTGTVSSQNYTTLYSSSAAGVASNNLVVDGTLTVNGCAILTNCTSFDLLPTTATTINFGLAATALNIGASTGVTLINNQLATTNYSFPTADGAANEVLTTDGAGNVYWALPGGGGSQFGNITVGIVTDNTISTTTGDLDITSATSQVNITGNLDLTGDVAVNGGDITTNQTTANLLNATATTVNAFGAATTVNIGAATGATNINNNLNLDGTLTLNGSSSGSSTFSAPATGSVLSYVLPGSAGAANTVLTNDGSGNLSWALPGGGGSQFGNITVGIVTDNTISTTTGDLDITSATNQVNITGDLDLTGDLAVNGGDITTTQTTATVFNTTATTLNVGGAATTLSIGAGTGTTTINNNLVVDGDAEINDELLINADLSGTATITAYNGANSNSIEWVGSPTPGTGGFWKINEATRVIQNTASTSVAPGAVLLQANSIGTPTAGFGVGLWYEVETAPSNVEVVGRIEAIMTDVSSGAEDANFDFQLMSNGTLGLAATLDSVGNFTAAGNFITDASLFLEGATSGYSQFTAPATGSNLSYVLPGSAGAANTVLTNDGSGNLSWALPGGGGSTFGNVSVGVVTDNTISTTSGDLDITSTTGVINLDTYTTLTDGRLTTTSVSTVTLDSFAVATYQNATYFINVKDAVTGDIQSTKVDIMHNGTTAYINQYANMTTTADLSTFAATISGGTVLLEITPASTNSTQFTFSRTALRV